MGKWDIWKLTSYDCVGDTLVEGKYPETSLGEEIDQIIKMRFISGMRVNKIVVERVLEGE